MVLKWIQLASFLVIASWALLVSPVSLAFTAGNVNLHSFAQAKKIALKIHKDHATTIYCGCRYEGKTVDLRSCGYQAHHDFKRAARLEWEHVVPAEAFGQSFSEWRMGAPGCFKNHGRGKSFMKEGRTFKGRKCAETNPEFRRMESDLYNLWPEIGELNGLRNNFTMAEIPGPGQFGGCHAKVGERKFEPGTGEAKGRVARVYLYMGLSYPGRGIVSNKNEKLFEAWDKANPVTPWECERARRIENVQGNPNPILKARCSGRAFF
ncbi:MAG: endonuclease [Methylotenera sp.]|nr:endonuclease [Oligoflexia bacterium]